MIQRIPHSDRYLPTEHGLTAALVLTQTHNRILTPALAAANDPLTDLPHLNRAINNVETALDRLRHPARTRRLKLELDLILTAAWAKDRSEGR